MKRTLPWLLATVFLAAAWVVAAVTPDDDAATQPFVVQAKIGEPAVGRTFAMTVEGVRRADGVVGAEGWSAEGSWLLVDVVAEGRGDGVSGRLLGAVLTIGERTFRASERAKSMFGTPLVSGIPRAGTLAFEVPEDAFRGTGVLEVSNPSDPRGDSVISLAIDLEALQVETDAQIRPADWAAS